MAIAVPSRRILLLGLAAAGLARAGFADTVIDLEWRDLLPEDDLSLPGNLAGLPHDESSLAARQPASTGVRTDWTGRIVRMSGFIVPIDQRGTGVIAFILVPYVGACIHVPPPPPNQLVFVTTETPWPAQDLWDAIWVSGRLSAKLQSTELAEIGYEIRAERIAIYEW